MSNYFIKAKAFLLKDKVIKDMYLEVVEGKFGDFTDTVKNDAKIYDYSDYTIAPGLFDTHIHGINGFDIMDGTVQAVQEISRSILTLGVTRFLPTTLTSAEEDLEQAIRSVDEAVNRKLPGAQSEGIFLEGPYF